MGEGLNISIMIFRCETPSIQIFGGKNWYTYLQIFLKNPYNRYELHTNYIRTTCTDYIRTTCTDYIRMGIPVDVRLSVHACKPSSVTLERKGAPTLCSVAECNKMQPYCVANGGNNVNINAARLRQGFYMPQHAMWHENSIGKMSVSSKDCCAAYDE